MSLDTNLAPWETDFGAAPDAPAGGLAPWETDFGAAPTPTKVAEEPESGDFSKGFKRAFAQVPELAYGTATLASMSAEKLFGEGGVSTAAKNYFAEKYTAKSAENQKYAPTEQFTGAWDKLKAGDTDGMVDWLQDSAGYVIGQGLQTLATAGIGGAVAAGSTVGKAAVTKMLGGVVAKQATKIAEENVAKLALKGAAAEAAIKAAMPKATEMAARSVAQTMGAGVALAAQNMNMEAGDIYGGLIEEAKRSGKEITGDDLIRAWGMAAAAAGTEVATDMLGISALLGRGLGGKMVSSIPGGMGRAGRAAVAGAAGVAVESGQEYVQTYLEQVGAGKDTGTLEAAEERINAAAVGGLGGAMVGGAAGAMTPPKPSLQRVLDPTVTPEQSVDAAASLISAPPSEDTSAAMIDEILTGINTATGELTAQGKLPTEPATDPVGVFTGPDGEVHSADQLNGMSVADAMKILAPVDDAKVLEIAGMLHEPGLGDALIKAREQENREADELLAKLPDGQALIGLNTPPDGPRQPLVLPGAQVEGRVASDLIVPPERSTAVSTEEPAAQTGTEPALGAVATPLDTATPTPSPAEQTRLQAELNAEMAGIPVSEQTELQASLAEDPDAEAGGINEEPPLRYSSTRAEALETTSRDVQRVWDAKAAREGTTAIMTRVVDPETEVHNPEEINPAYKRITAGQARMARDFGKSFGKEVVFYTADRSQYASDEEYNNALGELGGGYIEKGDGRRIFIRAELTQTQGANESVMAIFGHELTHHLKNDMPDVYKGLQDAVMSQPVKLNEFYRYYNPQHAAMTDVEIETKLQDPAVREHVVDEFIADLGGNRATEHQHWMEVFRNVKDPNVVIKLGRAVLQFVKQIMQSAGFVKFKTDTMVSNLTDVRAAVTKAMSEYAKAGGANSEQAVKMIAGRTSETEAGMLQAKGRDDGIQLTDGRTIYKQGDLKTDEGNFSNYDVEKTPPRDRASMFTVHKSPDGYVVRNAILPEGDKRKGISTAFYRQMNEESIAKTGKPLRSTQPRKLSTGETVHELSADAVGLWDSFVRAGSAEKLGEKNYRFKQPDAQQSKSRDALVDRVPAGDPLLKDLKTHESRSKTLAEKYKKTGEERWAKQSRSDAEKAKLIRRRLERDYPAPKDDIAQSPQRTNRKKDVQDLKGRTFDELKTRIPQDIRAVSKNVMKTVDGKDFAQLPLDDNGPGFLPLKAMSEATVDASLKAAMDDAVSASGLPADIAKDIKVPTAKQMDEMYAQNNHVRYWYELSANGFTEKFFMLPKQETEKLIDVVAATSGGQEPPQQMRFTIAAMSQDARDVPITVGFRDAASVTAAFSPEWLNTHKFGNFAGTMQLIAGLRNEKPLPTIDLQMAKLHGMKPEQVASDPRAYEALARFWISVRDMQNKLLPKGAQPYESWQGQALGWVYNRGGGDPSDYAAVMPKIIEELKAAGIPLIDGKISEETLKDPRTADLLSPASSVFESSHIATLEVATNLTAPGRVAMETLAKLEGRTEPWARNARNQYEAIQRRAMKGLGNRKSVPGQKMKEPSLLSKMMAVIVGRNQFNLSRIDTNGFGSFEGAVNPNMRFPFSGRIGTTTEWTTPNETQRKGVLALLGKDLNQAASAASLFETTREGENNTYSIFVQRYDNLDMPQDRLSALDAALGFPLNYSKVANGWLIDINSNYADGLPVYPTFDMIKGAVDKALGNERFKLLPRTHTSDYVDASDYNAAIKEMENGIRRDTDARRGRSAWDSKDRLRDLRAIREEVRAVGKERDAAFKKWTKETQGRLEGLKQSTTRNAQWETPAFQRWFGDSKAVDANGDPLAYYHGTAQTDIRAFTPKQAGAIFLTKDPKFAESFSSSSADYMRAKRMRGGAETIYKVWVKADKPFDPDSDADVDAVIAQLERDGVTVDQLNTIESDMLGEGMPVYESMEDVADRLGNGSWVTTENSLIQKAMKDLGHDGFYVYEGGEKNLAVYDSAQIKSATGNTGAFNPADRDITRSTQRAQTETPEFKRWFGDSKVVDENGEPLVVHHGGLGAKDIRVFDADFGGQTTGNNEHGAFHFTNDPIVADDYSRQSFIRRYQDNPESLKTDGHVPEDFDFDDVDVMGPDYEFVTELAEEKIERQSVYLKIENPIVIDMENERVDVQQIERLSRFAKTGKDPDGAFFDTYMDQMFGPYDPDLVAGLDEEIKQAARDEFGLDADEVIELWQFEQATDQVMQDNGYEREHTPIDGIIIKNMIDDIGDASNRIADQYIVFESEQIKSATGNNGAFNPADRDITQSPTRGPVWYSGLTKAVEGISMKSATAQQWRGTIANLKGVKAAEIEATGLYEWLDLQGDNRPEIALPTNEIDSISGKTVYKLGRNPDYDKVKISKDSIVAYLNANGVQVEDVMRGEEGYSPDARSQIAEYLDRIYETKILEEFESDQITRREHRSFLEKASGFLREWSRNGDLATLQRAMRFMEVSPEEFQFAVESAEIQDDTQYSTYVTPGAVPGSYRELLLKLPGGGGLYDIVSSDGFIVERDVNADQRDAIISTNQDEYHWEYSANNPKGRGFVSPHFNEEKDILAHVRFNERVTTLDGPYSVTVTEASGSGKSTKSFTTRKEAEMFGRVKRAGGYRVDIENAGKARVLFLEEIQSDWAQQGKKDGFRGELSIVDNAEETAHAGEPMVDVVGENGLTRFTGRPNEAQEYMLEVNNGSMSTSAVPRGPFVTSTDAWVGLVLKRMIRHAAENGFNRVSWTNGEQQIDRYEKGLRKHVDAISWEKTPEGVHLKGYKNIRSSPDSERREVVNTRYAENELSDAIGKAMSERIKNDPAWIGVIEGNDIKIDDTGMATFYNKIVPKVARKISAKLRGGPVTVVDNQMGFDITPAMRDSVMQGQALFSRQRLIGDSGRAYTPEQLAAIAKAGGVEEVLSAPERITKWANKSWVQGVFDQFAPIKELSKGAYMLARLSKGAAGALEAFLQHGKLSIKDGAYDADTTGGAIDRVFIPLGKETTDFLRWVAGHRAERLAAEGLENLFTKDDIAAFKALDQGVTDFDYVMSDGTVTRDRTKIYSDSLKKFNAFQKNALDMAEQSGLIDGETRHLWEHDFYVPFYRVLDEEGSDVRGAGLKKGIVRQRAFQKLKGGTQNVGDLLENTLMNWSHLIDAGAKNRAAMATIKAAENLDVAVPITPGVNKPKNSVWYMENGKQKWYSISDPHLLVALNSLEYVGLRGPMWDAMTKMKHWLTIGVTASPYFKIRNLIRDSMQAIATSPMDYNVVSNVIEGYKATDRSTQDYVSALASGGLIRFGTMLEGNEAARTRQLIKVGNKAASILDSESAVQKFYDTVIEPVWSAWAEVGNRGEEINRMALYKQLRAKNYGHLEASYLARDMMDFSSQGTFDSIRILTQIVPFMNARLQGMYKLGRAGVQDPARMAVVIGAASLASLALLAAFGDDDDWKKREEWDRDTYWWFKFGGIAYRIPKPFEIGAAATLVERTAEFVFDKEMTGKRFKDVVVDLLANQLAMNPVPQALKPLQDIYANKDSFTGRPIESMSMQRLEPEFRYRAGTSLIARGASSAIGGALSPVQVDHLVRAYFGWLGSTSIYAADMAVRMASDDPVRPSRDMWKVATGGMVAEVDSSSSRYVTQMYEQAVELEQAYATHRALIKEGKRDEAREYRKENKDKIIRYQRISNAKRQLSTLNERIRAIERSAKTADEKRELILGLDRRKNELAKRLFVN